MLWDEIDLERLPARAALQKTAAQVFQAPLQDVVVVDDIANTTAQAPVILEVRKTGGDFPFRMAIYLAHPRAGLDAAASARALAKALGSRILISGHDPNPYLRDLVDPTGETRSVALERRLLDERGWMKLDERAAPSAVAPPARVGPRRPDRFDRFDHLLAVYEDLGVYDVAVTTTPQSQALSALTDALFGALHTGAPTADEKAAASAAVARVRAAFAPDVVRGPNGLTGLLEAAQLVVTGALD